MSPLFLAVIEATEEAVYNSLFRARTITGRGHTVEALPIEKTVEILRKYGAIAGSSQLGVQDVDPCVFEELRRPRRHRVRQARQFTAILSRRPTR